MTDEFPDDRTLARRGCSPRAIGYYRAMLADYNQKVDQLDKMRADGAPIVRQLRLSNLLEEMAFRLRTYVSDPKNASPKTLRSYIEARGSDIQPVVDYRKRVRNRGTAIRAKCVRCMDGQVHLVRECVKTNCALWPFRMGTDPFRGRLNQAEAPPLDAELAPEDDLGEIEAGDESDADNA